MTPARKAWYEANKEKMRAYGRDWYQRNKNNPERLAKEREKAVRRRKNKTGFCPDLVAAALDIQAGICPICEVDLEAIKQCADHDHSTGAPRGILCSRCNLAIGLLEDRPDLLRAAASYIENPPITGFEDLL